MSFTHSYWNHEIKYYFMGETSNRHGKNAKMRAAFFSKLDFSKPNLQ